MEQRRHGPQMLASLIVAALIVAAVIIVVTAKLGPNSGEDEGRDDDGGGQGHGRGRGGDVDEDNSSHGQIRIDGHLFDVRIGLPGGSGELPGHRRSTGRV